MEARWYQSEANAAAWQYIGSGQGNPLIVLPTGAGKSIVIALLIRQAVEWGQRVLVLAHRKELLQQNAEKIERLTGLDWLRKEKGIGIILLAHCAIKKHQDPTAESYDRYQPALHD
ncbi:MAG: DEAD/DEAH box helicase, partial [Planctomyces sp.]